MSSLLLPLLLAAGATGHVVEVTPGRAYLDRGSDDGLTAGMTLEIERGARKVGSCRVEHLAPHHSTCTGAAARPGDTFELNVGPKAEPVPARLAPLPSAKELLARNAAVRAAPEPTVVDRATPFAPGFGRSLLEARLGHATYTAIDSADGTFHQERLDLALRGVDTFASFRFYGDLTAVGFASRPANLTAFRRGTTAMLFVHEAELTNRDAQRPLVLSFGRVWPYHTPGVSVFDGAQAGARLSGGALEVGVYGGGLPVPDTLEPTLRSWTGGVYFMGQRRGARGAFSWMRFTARAGAVRVEGVGTRGEAEVSAMVMPVARVDVSAALRVQGGEGLDAPGIAAGRLDVGFRPVDRLRVSGGLRFLDREAAVTEFAQLASSAASLASTRHADLAAAWDVTGWITVGAQGGLAQDVTTGWVRRWAGPQVIFPHALGRLGSVGLGYQEEIGSASGRSAWTQATVVPADGLSAYARVSYFEDTADTPDRTAVREAGVMTGVSWRFVPELELSASVLVRPSIPPIGAEDLEQFPLGVLGDVGLRGKW